jgi:hypothetical protein
VDVARAILDILQLALHHALSLHAGSSGVLRLLRSETLAAVAHNQETCSEIWAHTCPDTLKKACLFSTC